MKTLTTNINELLSGQNRYAISRCAHLLSYVARITIWKRAQTCQSSKALRLPLQLSIGPTEVLGLFLRHSNGNQGISLCSGHAQSSCLSFHPLGVFTSHGDAGLCLLHSSSRKSEVKRSPELWNHLRQYRLWCGIKKLNVIQYTLER